MYNDEQKNRCNSCSTTWWLQKGAGVLLGLIALILFIEAYMRFVGRSLLSFFS